MQPELPWRNHECKWSKGLCILRWAWSLYPWHPQATAPKERADSHFKERLLRLSWRTLIPLLNVSSSLCILMIVTTNRFLNVNVISMVKFKVVSWTVLDTFCSRIPDVSWDLNFTQTCTSILYYRYSSSLWIILIELRNVKIVDYCPKLDFYCIWTSLIVHA